MQLGLVVALAAAAATATTATATANPARDRSAEPLARSLELASQSFAEPPSNGRRRWADFNHEPASNEARHVAHWVVDSGDNQGLPFVIIDKVDARVFVFDPDGRLQGSTPALLGMQVGDGSAAGIGDQKISAIRPEDRTTPAGRFLSSLDHDLQGREILWIDYDSALALHRVTRGSPEERRAQRLDSPSPLDNRISYGCVNVPGTFYEDVLSPVFQNTFGVVYILPEQSPARDLFGSYEVESAPKLPAALP